ncbi:MAG: hypothetical protein HYR79_03500 [Nitrospirae bacterium]|nr:hypothetical protein [Nitrospirota bacterium]
MIFKRVVFFYGMVGMICLLTSLSYGNEIPDQVKQDSSHPEEAKRPLSRFQMPGYVRNETAYRLFRPSAYTKLLNIVSLYPTYAYGSHLSLSGRIRAFYDAVYDLEDVDTISPRKGPDVILTQSQNPGDVPPVIQADNVRDVEIRKQGVSLKEFYLDLHFSNLDVRAGKQIVRWGVNEGARVLDEINPLDFEEYILREVEDRYIPLWMVKTDLYYKESRLEALLIPDLEFHRPAPSGSEWEQSQFVGEIEKPPVSIGNSEWAVQLHFPFLGWDSTVSYFYTWDDFPVVFREIRDVGIFGVSPVVLFTPRYTRLRIFGGSATRNIGDYVINAEGALVRGKYFGTRFGNTPSGPIFEGNGEKQKNYLKYAFSAETSVHSVTVSLQFLQQVIMKYDPALIQDQYDTVWGLFLRREWIHNTLITQYLGLFFINKLEWLHRPKITYRVTDSFSTSLGGDILYGDISDFNAEGEASPGDFHFVGFFKNNSRIYLEFTYTF